MGKIKCIKEESFKYLESKTVTRLCHRTGASCQLLIAEAWVHSQGSAFGICGQSGTGTSLSLSSSVFLYQ